MFVKFRTASQGIIECRLTSCSSVKLTSTTSKMHGGAPSPQYQTENQNNPSSLEDGSVPIFPEERNFSWEECRNCDNKIRTHSNSVTKQRYHVQYNVQYDAK